jgi:hypothetical protein
VNEQVDGPDPLEGCPDCGRDTVELTDQGTLECARVRCGWRE